MSIQSRTARAGVLLRLREAQQAIASDAPADEAHRTTMQLAVTAAASNVHAGTAAACVRALLLAQENPLPVAGVLSPQGIAHNASLLLEDTLWHPQLSRWSRRGRLRRVTEALSEYRAKHDPETGDQK